MLLPEEYELASLARTLTTLGRLKTSTITRVYFVNRSKTFLRERSNILFGSFGTEGDLQCCIESVFLG